MKGLILTYLLAYGGAALSLFMPLVGLCVYVAFSVARPQVLYAWAGDLSGLSRIVGVAVLLGWAFRGLGRWSFREARTPVFALGAYFACLLISAAFASHQGVAWDSVLDQLKFLLPFLAGITLMRTRTSVNALAWTIVLAQGLVGFEMNWSYIHGWNQAHESGLLGDNNTFAVSLVTVIGPALFLGLSATRIWQKVLALGCAAMIMHTVLLSFSRGGMLAMLVVGVAVVVVIPKRPSFLVAIVLAAILTVRLTGPQVLARFQTTFASGESRDPSAQSRIELWRDCFQLMVTHPFTGVGPRHWPIIAESFGWTKGKAAHTYWLEVGAEIGVPGLACLIVFFLTSLGRSWRLSRQHGDPWLTAMGCYTFTGLVGFMCGAQFVTADGNEVPFFVALVALSALEVARLEPAKAAETVPAASFPLLARQALKASGARRAAR